MKRTFWLVVIILLAAGSVWAQFYERLSDPERRNLAEAYYLVGRRYAEQGQKEKARDFEQMAYNIWPSLDPASIQAESEPAAAALILKGEALPAEAVEPLLRSHFLRLASAFLTEDPEAMLELMDGSVYFTRLGEQLSQPAIRSDLESFFARTDLSGGLPPSQVYDLNSLEVAKVPEAPQAWGEVYAVRIQARKDFSDQVAFWEQSQQYLFHRVQGRWLIFSVGSGLPPSSWEPEAPRAAVGRPSAAEAPPADPVPQIRDAFLTALNYFLAKEPDQASQYFTREIQILRLNTSLSREEMASTFEGYFEGSDFRGVTADGVLDTNSIAIEPSDRFTGRIAGRVYLLSVKTKLDLSDRIPFWTRFQEYYFNAAEGAWKIFAIF
jgi:hypothetical protein